MADQQRRVSRFGLSWFSALRGGPRPNEGSPGVQRPPFRPAGKIPMQLPTSHKAQQKNETARGKVPAELSSQSQAPQKSETQTLSSSRTSQTRATSTKPSSESRSTEQPQAASVPSLPQQKASQPQVEKQAAREGQSPSRLLSEPSGQKESPASPSSARNSGQARQTHKAVPSTPTLSNKKVESATKDSSKPYPVSAPSSRAISQETAKPVASQALSQQTKSSVKSKFKEEGSLSKSSKPPEEPNSKAEFKVEPPITSREQEEGIHLASKKPTQELKPNAEFKPKSALNSKNHSPVETISQSDSATKKPTQVLGPASNEATKSKKSDFKENNDEKLTSISERQSVFSEEKWKVAGENIEDETKGTSQKTKEPRERIITKLSTQTLGKNTNDLTTTFQGHKFQDKHKSPDIEKKVSNSKGLEIKNLTSTSAQSKGMHDLNVRTHQRPQISHVQKTPLHKEIREDVSKYVPNLSTGNSTKLAMDENPVSVITVAGENKGATMHVDSNSKKDDFIHIRRGYKVNTYESPEATTDGEESSKGKQSKKQDSREQDTLSKSYINSNMQSINNSLLFSSSVNEKNPGVHFALSSKPAEPIILPCCRREPFMPRRAEFKVTPVEKRSYEPRVRRRCLRGLFLEPSDSDPENPDKPRRHGCKVSCDNSIF